VISENKALVPMTKALPLDRNPAAVYLARLAPGSRPAMQQALEVVAGVLGFSANVVPWHALRYSHTQAIRTRLAERYAPASVNKILCAVRCVLHEAFRLGLVSAEEYQRAVDIPSVKGSRLPAGRCVSSGELRALFKACDAATASGSRDAALVGVLYACGLRRAEVVSLDLADWNAKDTALLVLGKGNRQRRAYLADGALAALEAWLIHRGDAPGPLFCRVIKGGRVTLERLTEQAVFDALRRLASRAGVARFSPHDLRRTFVGDLLDGGADLSVVQQLSGHASPATTARYDRRPDEVRRRAARSLHVPFVPAS
jgi:site-specific recombinase XerD